VPVELNLDDLCGDVMSMNLSDEGGTSFAFKSDAAMPPTLRLGVLTLYLVFL